MNEYPLWMTEGLNKCKCGSGVVLFYLEGQNYKVECIKCGIKVNYKASNTQHAKYIWNNRLFEVDHAKSTKEEAWKRVKDYVDMMRYTYIFEEIKKSYQDYYMSGSYISYSLNDIIRFNEEDCKLLFEQD